MSTETSATRRRGEGLALVGYRGTGKSTVAGILADLLARPCFDADRELEARAGRTIARIFAEGGESAFRDLEEETLRTLVLAHPGAILSTGGGVILREANRRMLGEFGLVVWLRAEPEELARRLRRNPSGLALRPSLTAAGTLDEIAAVLATRIPLYREVADVEVDTTGLSPAEVARRILELRPQKSRSHGPDGVA